jgi:RNA polymerase-binding transcription factor
VSDSDFDRIKTELHRRRRMLLESVRRAAAEIEALRSADRLPEFEEGAQLEHETFTLARLGETQQRELQQVDAALARIEAGDYGMCRDCETEIDPRRLDALPYALLCTDCAARRERGRPLISSGPPTL